MMSDIFTMHFSLEMYVDLMIRLSLACVCGGVIGYERRKRLKEAGIRTHLIVCLASALVMIISKYGFVDMTNAQGASLYGTNVPDPARIAAQVISGISFLGAGVIFHHENTVKGLTTAAGIWATSGVGLCLGAGMYGLGLFVTVIMTLLQLVIRKFGGHMGKVLTMKLSVTVKNNRRMRDKVQAYIESKDADIIDSRIDLSNNGEASYHFTLRMNQSITLAEMNELFEGEDDICDISFESCS